VADALERWRGGWRGSQQVVVASEVGSVVGAETQSVLAGAGLAVSWTHLRDERGDVSPAVREAEVMISGGSPLDVEVFEATPKLRFLLRPYVGYDDIQVDAATERGILVANVPDTFVQEVADHTLALVLAAQRRLPRMDGFVRDGRWARGEQARATAHPVRRLSTMTLGLVGFGAIARLVTQRAHAFGLRIVACDPYVSPDTAAEHGVTLVRLEELLAGSDIVSLHVFLNAETRHLIDAERLAMMKPDAILVNTSRGPVVNEAALVEALRSGRLAGAALDVFEQEPLGPTSPLIGLPNVILLPHYASYSDEGDALHRQRVGQLALQAALGGLPERKVIINKGLYDALAAMPELAGVTRY
jgi:D-3-phosphoglycerate dehydrogenase / 2-oxoglutarate reductase